MNFLPLSTHSISLFSPTFSLLGPREHYKLLKSDPGGDRLTNVFDTLLSLKAVHVYYIKANIAGVTFTNFTIMITNAAKAL